MATTLPHVEIDAVRGRGRIVVDGHEMPGVSGIWLEMEAGKTPVLTLRILAGTMHIAGNAEVRENHPKADHSCAGCGRGLSSAGACYWCGTKRSGT